MKSKQVGIRELKANLSACLRQIKSGHTLVITERGIPIGRLAPVEPALEEELLEGTRSRMWAWNGKAWKPSPAKLKLRGKATLSDLLLEDRE